MTEKVAENVVVDAPHPLHIVWTDDAADLTVN
jgi:hypothetical protein